MASYSINHKPLVIPISNGNPIGEGSVTYSDNHVVTEHGMLTPTFEGPYTECLMYVGARANGHAHQTAVSFAKGRYK